MKESIIDQIRSQIENIEPLNATCKIKLEDACIFIDGTMDKNVVSTEDSEAQCTIITTGEVLLKMRNGELNPMSAVIQGHIIIKGEMGLAMKLQSILSEE